MSRRSYTLSHAKTSLGIAMALSLISAILPVIPWPQYTLFSGVSLTNFIIPLILFITGFVYWCMIKKARGHCQEYAGVKKRVRLIKGALLFAIIVHTIQIIGLGLAIIGSLAPAMNALCTIGGIISFVTTGFASLCFIGCLVSFLLLLDQ